MELSRWLYEALWRREDMPAQLAKLADPLDPARALDLARATEYIVPDRRRALALYVAAWRAGQRDALTKVRSLAKELRAYDTLAELALADGDPVAAGAAYIDAGAFPLAIETLGRITQPARSFALEVKALLAIARRELHDPHREVAQTLARAQQPHEDARRLLLHAARVARTAALDGSYASVLATAQKRFPTDPDILDLVEDRLLARRGADDLLEHYRVRFEAAPSSADWVERVRAAGSELLARHVQPGLGLRLLRRSLEHAYGGRLTSIPRHLASWQLLVEHARASRSMRELVPLIVEALQLPLAELDRIYLARLGLEFAWKDAGDLEAARPYAATLATLVPDHPTVRAFLAAESPQLFEESRVTFLPTPPDDPTPPPPREAAPPPPAPAGATQAPSSPIQIIPPAALEALRRPKPLGLPAIPPPRRDAAPRAPRTVIPIDIVVELPGGELLSVVVRDLSTSGLFLLTTRELALGTLVTIELRLPITDTLHAQHRIAGKLVRRTDLGYGLAFIDPTPEITAAITRLNERGSTS